MSAAGKFSIGAITLCQIAWHVSHIDVACVVLMPLLFVWAKQTYRSVGLVNVARADPGFAHEPLVNSRGAAAGAEAYRALQGCAEFWWSG
jgi:hypothetical protein